jgi:hypothetical protein
MSIPPRCSALLDVFWAKWRKAYHLGMSRTNQKYLNVHPSDRLAIGHVRLREEPDEEEDNEDEEDKKDEEDEEQEDEGDDQNGGYSV